MSKEALHHLAAREDSLLADLTELVRIPSQSADPAYSGDVKRAAQWCCDRLRKAGLENVELLETKGYPVIYADWLHAPDAPTALIYAHYDVQPATPENLWESPAFEPQVRDGRFYGRGAADDKSGVVTSIAAVEALVATGGAGVNLKFIFEGEEEIGSPSLEPFLAAERARFACDIVVSVDGGQWSADQPCVILGLRGLCEGEIHVNGPKGDLHSGLHGGAIMNPIEALARIVATFRHPDGRIAVEGFYDAVVDPTPADREAIARVPFDEAAYPGRMGVPESRGEPGFTTLERRWIRPTFELNGVWGGYTGPGPKTIIPSAAHAKFTCRLVADQDPNRIFALVVNHVEKNTPPGVVVRVVSENSIAIPYSISMDHPANRLVTDVLTEVFGIAPYQTRTGGSIPVVSVFSRILGAPTVFMGSGTNDSNLHAPNEFVYVRNLHRGAQSLALLLPRLATLKVKR
ncbi:MAG TPA: dipeptidase [Opitutaceae bacterium]|nr:dipeptidase [Opitutaceae bacterium]